MGPPGVRLTVVMRLAALFTLASCTAPFDLSGQRIAPPGPEWGIVIGSVLVLPEPAAGGRGTGHDVSQATYEFDIVEIQPGDPNGEAPYARRYVLDAQAGRERLFIARLRPGSYLVRRFHEESMAPLGGDLDLIFTAGPGDVRYIGRLRVEIPRRVSSGTPYRFSIEDARDSTLKRLSSQPPELTEAVVSAPMHLREPATP
jgi:hypothetical protein